MLQEAQAYKNRGWNVFPTKGKLPALQWGKYQTTTVTAEDINNWFQGTDYDVAIVTGKISGIAVVDIDPKRGGDVAQWLERYPTGCVVRTGSGGGHCYYSYPEGTSVSNAVDIEPGIDIRGDGGYVVAPPSRHASGGRYEWVNQGKLTPFPVEILEYPEKKHEQRVEEHWISNLLENGSKEGSRNADLASLCGYFASIGSPRDVASGIIRIWNARNAPPIDSRELERTIESVYATARKRASSVETPVAKTTYANLGAKDFNLMAFDDYMATYGGVATEWMISDWLPDQTICFLVSPPGTFKTWLLLDAAVSVAMGADFLGMYQVRNPGPVFLIQQEDFHGQTAERIAVIRKSKIVENETVMDGELITMDVPPKIPLYIHPDRAFKFDDPKALKALESSVAKIKPKLIILDPLYSAGSTDDYMAKTTEQMFFLKGLRDKYGCSFIIAHHTNKSDRDDRQRAWGSQFLNAFLETGWQLFPKGKASIKVKRHFKASENPKELLLSFHIDTKLNFSYEVEEGAVDVSEELEEKSKEKSKKKSDVVKPVLLPEPSDPQIIYVGPEGGIKKARPNTSKMDKEAADVLNFIYDEGVEVSWDKIHVALGVSRDYIMKITSKLVKANILKERKRLHMGKVVSFWRMK